MNIKSNYAALCKKPHLLSNRMKEVFFFPVTLSHYILFRRDRVFLGYICDIFLSCFFVYTCICLFVLLQWTRSTIWHLQPLLQTTCTIPSRHSRPILLALLTCLVSQCSRSCWVQIGVSMKKCPNSKLLSVSRSGQACGCQTSAGLYLRGLRR